jgi:hypothetical protein
MTPYDMMPADLKYKLFIEELEEELNKRGLK